jgi:hypothetical protein
MGRAWLNLCLPPSFTNRRSRSPEEQVSHISFVSLLTEVGGALVTMSETMTLRGLVRVASIVSTIAEEPMNAGGTYTFD